MYIYRKKDIKEMFEGFQTGLNYKLGQNYLISSSSIQSFISYLSPVPLVIEIGPGIGNITVNYFKKYPKVLLVEIDKEKIPILKSNLTKANNGNFPESVKIINKNILEVDIKKEINKGQEYQIIGALPYNISKKIIRKTLSLLPPPNKAVFIIQKEVANNYSVNTTSETFLSISSKLYANVEKKEIIPKKHFFPVPKVDSRIMIIDKYKFNNIGELESINSLSTFIKNFYLHPRKKISSSISSLNSIGIANKVLHKRPHEITFGEWKSLYNSLNKFQ